MALTVTGTANLGASHNPWGACIDSTDTYVYVRWASEFWGLMAVGYVSGFTGTKYRRVAQTV